MTILSAIGEIQTTIRAISGIRNAPQLARDDFSVYPFVVAYPSAGTVKPGPDGMTTALHDIVVELHGTRKDLPRDLKRIYNFSAAIPDAIHQAQKDGDYSTIKAIAGDIEQELVPMSWNGVDTLGFRYLLKSVKVQATATTTAAAATGKENIQAVCASLQKAIRADHTSIRKSPSIPTEQFSAYPFVVTYPASGTSVLEYGVTSRTHYTVNTELHAAGGKGLSTAITKAIGFVDTIPQTIFTADFYANMRHMNDLTYTFGWMAWGNMTTLGWRFAIRDVTTEAILL